MIHLLREYLNQIKPYPHKISYQLVFSNDPSNISTVNYDYHTLQVDNTTLGIIPNSLVYGQDNIPIPTDEPEYINDCLDHLISSNLINNYEYNKIILNDSCIRFESLINDIQWKLDYLGYPKYMTVYKYMNGIITAQATYPLYVDIHRDTNGLSNGNIIYIEVYINPMDKLCFTKTY